MNHSSLGFQQAMRACLAHIKTSLQARVKGPSRSAMEWEALFCHGEGATSGGKQIESTLPFSAIKSGSSNGEKLES